MGWLERGIGLKKHSPLLVPFNDRGAVSCTPCTPLHSLNFLLGSCRRRIFALEFLHHKRSPDCIEMTQMF